MSVLNKISGFYNNSQSLVKGSASFFLMNVAGVFLNFIFALIAGNSCGSEPWGQYTLCLTVLQLVCVFSRMGLDTLIVRMAAESYSENSGKVKDFYIRSVYLTIFIGFIFSIFLFLLSETIATSVFKNQELISQLKLISFAIIPMNLLMLNSETMKGVKFPLASSFFRNASVWLIALPVLGIAVFFNAVSYLTEIYICAVILSWLASNVVWIKHLDFITVKRINWLTYREILNQSTPMMLANSLFYLMVWTETLMLGIYLPENEVGVYNMAFRISVFLTLATVAVGGVTAPDMAIYNSKNDKAGLQNVINRANHLVFWSTLPVIIVVILLASPILGFFGEEFKDGNITLILLAGSRLAAIFGGRLPILSMLGKQKIDQYIALTILIIDIALNIFLIPVWGINGAATATLITSVVWTVISSVYIRKALHLDAFYIPFYKKAHLK